MEKVIVEVCCGSADDAIEAERAGADRVELNSCLFHGGLTPTIGSLVAAKEVAKNVKIMAMVRPREGGFCYTDVEFRCAMLDAQALLENGADGIVFGFLTESGTVDIDRCRAMLKVIGQKDAVFHRAIDVVPNWQRALDELIDLGVTRVLTSGQESNVYFGADTVCAMNKYAAGRIEILPGAGITLKNAEEIVRRTQCGQIHLAHHKICHDSSTHNNRDIFFGGALYPPEDCYNVTDRNYIHTVCTTVNQA